MRLRLCWTLKRGCHFWISFISWMSAANSLGTYSQETRPASLMSSHAFSPLEARK